MAYTNSLGCSGCLIEAIERNDESLLRKLLSAPDVKFHDTFWISCPVFYRDVLLYPGYHERFPALTSRDERNLKPLKCTHSTLDECLFPGLPPNIAMSVVFSAMELSTKNFNALQISSKAINLISRSLSYFIWGFQAPGISWLQIPQHWLCFSIELQTAKILLRFHFWTH